MPNSVGLVLAGAIALNAASSIVYIINDLSDRSRDRAHVTKKFRPLAAGKLTPYEVLSLMAILVGLLMMVVGYIGNSTFALIILGYVLGNLVYTLWIKHVPYLDILSVAIFTGLRVVAGFVLLGIGIEWYMVLVLVTLTLFVMSSRRLAELSVDSIDTRPALQYYSPHALKLLMTFFMMATVILYYVAFSFVAFPLVFTDVLYFMLLLSVHDYMGYESNKKNIAEDGFVFLLNHRATLVLLVLFILTLGTFLVLF